MDTIPGTVLSQVAACNALHEAEGRLARWLLMVQGVTALDVLSLTQEFLAEMLGTRRTTVAIVAIGLQDAKIIEYSRGKIKILNRDRLEKAACECDPIVHQALRELYQPTMIQAH